MQRKSYAVWGGVLVGLLFLQGQAKSQDPPQIPGGAGPVVDMDVFDAVMLTVRNNRTIKSAYLERVIQKYDLRVADDTFIPNLDFKGSLRKQGGSQREGETNSVTSSGSRRTSADSQLILTEKIPTGADLTFSWAGAWDRDDVTETTLKNGTWRASFEQPLLRGGGWATATAPVRKAHIQEEINIQNLKATLISTVSRAIRAYRSYLQTYKRQGLSNLSMDRARQNLEMNKYLIQAGRMARVELVQAQADVANQELYYQESINSTDRSRLDLISVIDINKQSRIQPVEAMKIEKLEPELEHCLLTAFENRPDYLVALLNMELSEIELALARNNRLWDLSLTADYRRNEEYGENAEEDEWMAGLVLSIPLYGDLSRRQRELAAQTNLEQARLGLEELRDNIEIEVLDAIRDVRSKWTEAQLARQARELSEKQLEIEQEKLKLGKTSNFEVVTFQNDLSSAQVNELNAEIGYLNALTSLDQTLGTTLDTWQIEVEE